MSENDETEESINESSGIYKRFKKPYGHIAIISALMAMGYGAGYWTKDVRLRRSMNEINRQVSDLKKENRKLSNRARRLKSALDSSSSIDSKPPQKDEKDGYTRLKRRIDSLQKTNRHLREKLDINKASYNDNKRRHEIISNRINELENRRENILYEIEEIKSDLVNLKPAASEQDERCASAREIGRESLIVNECSTAAEDSTQVALKESELEWAKERLRRLEKEIEKLHDKM